ncbi:MAG: AsmA-like C-terminal region-containing protein, partial [Flavobacteriales bacterium]
MKILKRVLYILLALFVLLIGSAIVLPIVFEDDIVKMVKKQANKNLKAEVDFGNYDLSLISTFPNFGLTIEDLTVKNKAPFKGTTLADIGKLQVTVDLMSVINGDTYEIEKVALVKPKIHVIVNPDGTANYNIMKPSKDTAAPKPEQKAAADTGGAPIKASLKKYSIKDAHLIYNDASLSFYTEAKGLDHSGSGDFTLSKFTLNTQTDIKELTLGYGGITYLDHAEFGLDADFGIDLNKMKFTFKENKLNLNALQLGFDGYFAMPKKGFDMDISYKTRKTKFRTLLSMVPAVYTKSFSKVKTSGKLGLKGHVKGLYSDNSFPGFGLDLEVQDGSFKYPSMPKAAKNIQMDLKVERDEGPSLDNTVVDLSRFHVELAGNPIDMSLLLKTPISDPFIDQSLKANIDLASLQDVIPMKDQKTVGNITADMELKGNYSTIEKENYDKFHAKGKVILMDMLHKSPSLPYDVAIKKSYFNFSPEKLELSKFESSIGKSDLKASGRIDNYLAYALRGDTLQGRFDIRSKRFDLNELMASPKGGATSKKEKSGSGKETSADTASQGGGESMGVIKVPKNVDFTLNAEMGRVLYDDITIKDLKGSIGIKDQVASLDNVTMKVFGGKVGMNGTYGTKDPTRPEVHFEYDLKGLDIQKTANTVNTVDKLAPIADKCHGDFSSKMTFNTRLKQNMGPDYDSMKGEGDLRSDEVRVKGFKALDKVADKVGMQELKEQKVKDVNISFEFHDGKVYVDPYTVTLEGSEATISGYTTFEQKMDYSIDMKVPRDKLGGKANKVMEGLVAKANKKGMNMSLGETIPVTMKVTGAIQDPKVGLDLKGAEGSSMKEKVKDKAKEAIDSAKKKVKEKAGKKLVEEARKKGDRIVKEAKKKAERIRQEARDKRDKIISEAEERAQNKVDEANNPIAKQAAKEAKKKIMEKARKEGDEKVKKADKKADRIVKEA